MIQVHAHEELLLSMLLPLPFASTACCPESRRQGFLYIQTCVMPVLKFRIAKKKSWRLWAVADFYL
jgi:hypothetical protein